MKVVVIGAGVMGLAAAHHAAKYGHDVTVIEADNVAGGMAAHFDFGGISLEKYYHFMCRNDEATIELMRELALKNKIRWRTTSMGYFIKGKLHNWGDPISLLKFPHLTFIEKARYGLAMFFATKRKCWKNLDRISAKEWLEKTTGENTYKKLWKPLFDKKFFEYSDNISAAWLWTRIKRLGNSRRSVFQEELGYIEGGCETLINALIEMIESRKGKVLLGTKVEEIAIDNGKVKGVVINGNLLEADAVISTIPTPLISKIAPSLSAELKAKYEDIKNIGVVCVVLKLKKTVSKHFWININDDRIEVPGIVEFSNLRPLADNIVFVPFYMPQTNPKFNSDFKHFIKESMEYIKILNPNINDDDLIDSSAGRLHYAQPICDIGFAEKIPPVQTPVKGLQIADTGSYYPEDRGVSESVRIGKLMAEAL
jgi:protoporphyrinogen oxidase